MNTAPIPSTSHRGLPRLLLRHFPECLWALWLSTTLAFDVARTNWNDPILIAETVLLSLIGLWGYFQQKRVNAPVRPTVQEATQHQSISTHSISHKDRHQEEHQNALKQHDIVKQDMPPENAQNDYPTPSFSSHSWIIQWVYLTLFYASSIALVAIHNSSWTRFSVLIILAAYIYGSHHRIRKNQQSSD